MFKVGDRVRAWNQPTQRANIAHRMHRKLWGYDLRKAVASLARAIRQEQRRYVYCDSCGCNVTDADCSCFMGS